MNRNLSSNWCWKEKLLKILWFSPFQFSQMPCCLMVAIKSPDVLWLRSKIHQVNSPMALYEIHS